MRLSRRVVLAGGLAVAGLPRVALAGGQFSAAEMATLTQLAFDLFPHPRLGIEAYRAVAAALVATPLAAPRLKAWKDGLAQLEAGSSIPWRRRKVGVRKAALQRMATQGVFFDWRANVAIALYHTPANARRLGFPGASVGFGGWNDARLNDLRWLPEPTV
jgi:hypothetical protein